MGILLVFSILSISLSSIIYLPVICLSIHPPLSTHTDIFKKKFTLFYTLGLLDQERLMTSAELHEQKCYSQDLEPKALRFLLHQTFLFYIFIVSVKEDECEIINKCVENSRHSSFPF